MSEHLLPEPPSVDFLSCVSRAQRSLYAFILTLVRQPADAEDVLQETNVVLRPESGAYRQRRCAEQLLEEGRARSMADGQRTVFRVSQEHPGIDRIWVDRSRQAAADAS
jgi:hypothetical protein